MKKIILSAIAMFMLGIVGAQEVKFGLKAGANSATLTGDTNDNTRSKIGFDLGFFSEILITEKWAIQPELLYSAQGYKVNKNATLLHYVNMPVMINFFVTKYFNLEAGPHVGFLTSAKTKFDDGKVDTKDLYKDVKDSYNSINCGLNFGAGYGITPNASLNFRYSLGLTNIVNNKSDQNFKNQDFEINNHVISLFLVFKYL